jgi:hypothetical protein
MRLRCTVNRDSFDVGAVYHVDRVLEELESFDGVVVADSEGCEHLLVQISAVTFCTERYSVFRRVCD